MQTSKRRRIHARLQSRITMATATAAMCEFGVHRTLRSNPILNPEPVFDGIAFSKGEALEQLALELSAAM